MSTDYADANQEGLEPALYNSKQQAGEGYCGDDLSTDDADANQDELIEPGLYRPNGLISTPNVKTVLFLAVALQTVHVGFEEAYPLWALSTPDVGGLGWGTMEIGKVLLATGLILVVSQLVLFPSVVKTLGIVTLQRVGCILCVPAFLSIPAAPFLSWDEASLYAVSVASNTLVNCGLTTLTIALVVASTSMVPANMRGKLSGLFNMAENMGRFLGPAGYAITFAWSISPSAYSWVDYRFVFYGSAIAMGVVTAVGWKSLTVENMMRSAERGSNAASVPVAAVEYGSQASSASLSPVRRPGGVEADLV